jgi:hypothetical protein
MPEPVRDPAGAITALWEACRKHPDQRVTQVIVNALGTDPFYVEDPDAITKLYEYAALVPGSTMTRRATDDDICDVCGEERRAKIHTDTELHPDDAADGLTLHAFAPVPADRLNPEEGPAS